MKYSAPRIRENALENDGILYFRQRMEEMLFNYTIDLFRMPLLNTHGLAYEYCEIAKKVHKNEIKEYQLIQIYDEFINSFKHDIVLKECWGQHNIDRIMKSLGSSSKEDKFNIIAYLHATFDNNKYYSWCEQTLKKYVSQAKQKKKLEETIRCWIPEIIFLGYSADYIYSEIKTHFSSIKVANIAAFMDFLDMFNFKAHEYSVYFSVSHTVLNFQDILQKRLRVQFEDDGNFSCFKIGRNKVIIYFNGIKALCPNNAAESAYKRLDMFFSFYKLVGNKRGFSQDKKAMVFEKGGRPVFVDARRYSYSIIENINLEEIGKTSDALLTGLLINAESEYLLLRKSIELHNTALAVPDLKSGFLNLWASIEVLFQSSNLDGKFERVIQNVLPILKKDYINTIVSNIKVGMKDNLSESEYQSIIDSITDIGCENKKMFYLLFLPQHAELRKKCYELLSDYPVLRNRIFCIAELNSTKKLQAYIDKYVQRIRWHLYRMYRTRNAIIHSGDVPWNIKYLGEHLHSYVDSTLLEYIAKLSGEVPFESASNVAMDIQFAVDNIECILKKDQPLTENIVNTLIHPEIGYTMHCEQHVEG